MACRALLGVLDAKGLEQKVFFTIWHEKQCLLRNTGKKDVLGLRFLFVYTFSLHRRRVRVFACRGSFLSSFFVFGLVKLVSQSLFFLLSVQ